MGRFALVLALAVSICFSGGPARAFEFELGGEFGWTYEWYGQRGNRGFFGPYDVDNGTHPVGANLNFWNGGQFDTNITTGAKAGWSYFSVQLDPVFKLNEAIRIKGRYRLGSYGDPNAADYVTQDAPGVNVALSEGQWTLFWATAQTPFGQVGIGKRPWKFGTGLQYDGDDAASTESVVLNAPYGPFDIGVGFYPFRTSKSAGISGADVFDLAAAGVPEYFSRADHNGMLSKDVLGFVVYHSGPMQAGVLGEYGAYHVGPESVLGGPAAIAVDASYCHGSVFTKYNNGRFFFNSEAAWLYWTDKFRLAAAPAQNPRYIEQWRYMVEAGIMAGPAKLTLLHAWAPGPDRRNGVMVGKQSAAFVWHPTFDNHLGSFSVFRPYGYIFSYNYGSGLNAYNFSADGYVRDASVLAGRLDYAVAANLNLFGTFFYANRVSNGYSWGCIAPNVAGTPDGNINFNFNRYADSPNIPDSGLGYEIDLGFDWQLLDKWSMGVLVGYWLPGKWFNYACIDRSVPGWDIGDQNNWWGTRPGRTIDPVVGGEVSLTFEF